MQPEQPRCPWVPSPAVFRAALPAVGANDRAVASSTRLFAFTRSTSSVSVLPGCRTVRRTFVPTPPAIIFWTSNTVEVAVSTPFTFTTASPGSKLARAAGEPGNTSRMRKTPPSAQRNPQSSSAETVPDPGHAILRLLATALPRPQVDLDAPGPSPGETTRECSHASGLIGSAASNRSNAPGGLRPAPGREGHASWLAWRPGRLAHARLASRVSPALRAAGGSRTASGCGSGSRRLI